jgi:AcrR family transcriptional regulator
VAGRGRRTTISQPRGTRRQGSDRRAELLERVVEHLLQHGIANFSLRSAAHVVGASARMLVHYFGSKERLLSEALAMVRARQVEHLAPARAMPISSFDEVFRESWRSLASADFRRYFLLNHELMALALRDPRRYRPFLQGTTEEWRTGLAASLVAQGFSSDDASAVSTMYMAALRGLLLDLVVTRDRERVDKALERVAEKLKSDLERHGSPGGRASKDPDPV